MFDYASLTTPIVSILKELSGLPVRYGDSVIEQAPYPFITYKLTSPRISTQQDVEGEQWEAVLSVTIRAENPITAFSHASNVAVGIKLPINRDVLYNKGITIVDVNNVTSRDDFITIDYEFTAGFDFTVRIAEIAIDETKGINEVKLL